VISRIRAAWRRPLAPAVLAIALIAIELVLLALAWRAGFAGERALPAALDIPLAHAILWLAGGGGAAAATAAIHRALAGFRPVAATVVVLTSLPFLVAGVASVYGSLLVAGWL
jgi:hypothetical protein